MTEIKNYKEASLLSVIGKNLLGLLVEKGVGGIWVQLGGQGAHARVILVLRECIWNAAAV